MATDWLIFLHFWADSESEDVEQGGHDGLPAAPVRRRRGPRRRSAQGRQ